MIDRDRMLQRARIISTALSVVGIVLSCLALEQHVRFVGGFSSGPSWCNINSHLNCEVVNSSEWSAFLGIPIASYGLFFYAVLLIFSVSAASTIGAVSIGVWSSINLFLTLASSLASLTLLAISEFVIGALCLICVGVYVINFILLTLAWWSGWRGDFCRGVRSGVFELGRLIGITLGIVPSAERRAAWRVRGASLLVILSAAVSVVMPTIFFNLFSAAQGDEIAALVTQWSGSPVTRFELDTSGGAFADYSRGNPGAPLKIVEFADYECPACKATSLVMNEILSDYEGMYHVVFKNYPLDSSCNPGITREMHKYACTAAYFSRCAGEQGKFWEASELLFLRDADSGELSAENLIANASNELGLDVGGMRECMESGRYRDRILKDIQDGDAVGLQGTPSIWINGKLVEQPTPQLLKAIFESLIGKS